MSETGSTRFPEPLRPSAALPQSGRDNGKNALQIIRIRDESGHDIRNTSDKPLRIQGEIISAEKNGKLQIKTTSGTLEIETAPQDARQKAAQFKAGQKIEIDLPPERQRSGTSSDQNQIQAQGQIRIRETRESAPKDTATQNTAPERSTQTSVPYAPRPDTYTPPTKAPEQLTPQDIAQGLSGVPVRLDPVTPAQQQALNASLLNTPPALVLPAALTSQIEALAQAIPMQITSEQTAALLQTTPAQAPTPKESVFTVQNQNVAQILLSATIANPLMETPQSGAQAATAYTKLTDPINIFKQPFDIKSNFLFLSPETIKLSASATAQYSMNGQAGATNAPPVISQPVTAIFSGLQFPPVTLHHVPAPLTALAPPATQQQTSLPTDIGMDVDIEDISPFKADPFSKADLLLTQNAIGRLSATVQGLSAHNLPIIHFPDTGTGLQDGQSFILQAPLGNIPAGSLIELTPQNPSGALLQGGLHGTISVSPQAASFMPLLPEKWPVLNDILQTLNAATNATGAAVGAANASGMMLPSPSSPAQMGAVALFVIAAIRAGDLSQILSERSQNILRIAGKGSLMTRLSQEGQAIGRGAAEPSPQDWRSLSLPMLWENEVNKVILHYKHDQGGDEGAERDEGKRTRFIFDLDLSRMGKVQLDGLFREKRMDLILRTHEPFSRSMQLHIQSGYSNAMELTGLSGDLSFQNDPRSWVNVKTVDTGQFKSNI